MTFCLHLWGVGVTMGTQKKNTTVVSSQPLNQNKAEQAAGTV